MAVPMFLKLDPPYSYAIFAGAILFALVMLVAYFSIRCPRCDGSLWLLGMGFVGPAQSGPGQNCPKCGVCYEQSTGL